MLFFIAVQESDLKAKFSEVEVKIRYDKWKQNCVCGNRTWRTREVRSWWYLTVVQRSTSLKLEPWSPKALESRLKKVKFRIFCCYSKVRDGVSGMVGRERMVNWNELDERISYRARSAWVLGGDTFRDHFPFYFSI